MSADIKTWQERMDKSGRRECESLAIELMEAEIADLRAELARRPAETLPDKIVAELDRRIDANLAELDTAFGIDRPAVVSEGQAVAWAVVEEGKVVYTSTSESRAQDWLQYAERRTLEPLTFRRPAAPAPVAPHDRQAMSHAEMLTILDPWPCSKVAQEAPVAMPVMEKYPHGWDGVDENCQVWLRQQPNGARLYAAPVAKATPEAPTAAQAPEVAVLDAAREYLDCVNENPEVDLEFATAEAHTKYDRVRSSLQKAIAATQPKAAPVAEAPTEGIRGPLIAAQKTEARHLYRNLHRFGDDALDRAIGYVACSAYVNGRLDFAVPATEQAKAEPDPWARAWQDLAEATVVLIGDLCAAGNLSRAEYERAQAALTACAVLKTKT